MNNKFFQRSRVIPILSLIMGQSVVNASHEPTEVPAEKSIKVSGLINSSSKDESSAFLQGIEGITDELNPYENKRSSNNFDTKILRREEITDRFPLSVNVSITNEEYYAIMSDVRAALNLLVQRVKLLETINSQVSITDTEEKNEDYFSRFFKKKTEDKPQSWNLRQREVLKLIEDSFKSIEYQQNRLMKATHSDYNLVLMNSFELWNWPTLSPETLRQTLASVESEAKRISDRLLKAEREMRNSNLSIEKEARHVSASNYHSSAGEKSVLQKSISTTSSQKSKELTPQTMELIEHQKFDQRVAKSSVFLPSIHNDADNARDVYCSNIQTTMTDVLPSLERDIKYARDEINTLLYTRQREINIEYNEWNRLAKIIKKCSNAIFCITLNPSSHDDISLYAAEDNFSTQSVVDGLLRLIDHLDNLHKIVEEYTQKMRDRYDLINSQRGQNLKFEDIERLKGAAREMIIRRENMLSIQSSMELAV